MRRTDRLFLCRCGNELVRSRKRLDFDAASAHHRRSGGAKDEPAQKVVKVYGWLVVSARQRLPEGQRELGQFDHGVLRSQPSCTCITATLPLSRSSWEKWFKDFCTQQE